MSFEVVVSLVGALGLGSVIGQWFAAGKDRRGSRAAVLVAISQVESARWAPFDTKLTFKDAARQLTSAALLARVPRSAVAQYLVLAQAATWLSEASWDRNPFPDDGGGGGISRDFAEIVRSCQAALVHVVWSPFGVRRVLLRRTLARLDDLASAAAANDVEIARELKRSRQYGVG